MRPPKTKRAAVRTTIRDSEQNNADVDDSALPWAVTIASRSGRRIAWRKFISRAGALAELRLLHARGVDHASVEGPTA